MNSQSRPGVPTIACGLCLSKRSCFSIDIPPTIGTIVIVVYFAADRKWSHTCQEQQKNQGIRTCDVSNSPIPVDEKMETWIQNLNELIPAMVSTCGTCNASSRVGVNINARSGPLALLFDKGLVGNKWFAVEIRYFSSSSKRRWRIGMTNARVFPEPVSAAPIMSWNNKGICYSYALPEQVRQIYMIFILF